jgi:hypothetical protein
MFIMGLHRCFFLFTDKALGVNLGGCLACGTGLDFMYSNKFDFLCGHKMGAKVAKYFV